MTMSDFGISLDEFQRPEDAALNVKVTDPVHNGEGIGKYTLYRVQYMDDGGNDIGGGGTVVDAADGSGGGGGFGFGGGLWVMRRYSDFVWLYERLQKERAGAIIAPPPEKMSGSQRFSPDFLEERRWQLERFLRRIYIHPELHDAPSLDIFLRADELNFHAARHAKGRSTEFMIQSTAQIHNNNNNNNPSSSFCPNNNNNNNGSSSVMMAPPTAIPKAHGMKKWLAKAKTSVTKDLVQSAEDEWIEDMERYIDVLDKQMKSVATLAATLIKRARQSSMDSSDLGVAIHNLSREATSSYDDNNNDNTNTNNNNGCQLGIGLEHMGNAVDQQSTLTIQYAEEEKRQFEEPIKDFLLILAAVKIALYKRQDKRVHYTTWLSSIAQKQSTLHKLRNLPGSEAKAFGVETSLQRKQTEAESMREEYEIVSQRLLREFDRFKREKVGVMKQTIVNFTKIQIAYNRRMEQNFVNLLPQLESIQIPNNNNNNNNDQPPSQEQNQNQNQQPSSSSSSSIPTSTMGTMPSYPNHNAGGGIGYTQSNHVPTTMMPTSMPPSIPNNNNHTSHVPIASASPHHETFADNCNHPIPNVGAIQYRNQPVTSSYLNGI